MLGNELGWRLRRYTFGAAQLGDRRRTRRLVDTANRILEHPEGTLPDKLRSSAFLKGLYRLVDCPVVTHESVLRPHVERTRQRMRQHDGVVLIIHDTTELDYTGITTLQAIGQIGNGTHRGYLCHNSLAVDPRTREVLGLAHQILFCRPDVGRGETRDERRQRTTRASRLWKRGSEAIGSAPEGHRWVEVCDRGGDLLEYLDHVEHARRPMSFARSTIGGWRSNKEESRFAASCTSWRDRCRSWGNDRLRLPRTRANRRVQPR